MKFLLLVVLFTGSLNITFANIRLPNIIGNNMVLQQQSQVKLWGWGEPYEKVVISTSWDTVIYRTIVDGNANWSVTISTPAAGGPHTITIKGNNTIVISNVMTGEVWLCSGQSNMEMCGNWGLKDIKDELPAAHHENIRFFKIPKTTAAYPQNDCEGQWVVCDSNTLKAFTAVGYFFGKKINSELHVPVGLVQAAWGGSSADVWTPDSIIHADPVLKEAAAKILPNGQCPSTPGYAWNGMIAPVTRYAIAGAIWYQGENNTLTAGTYHRLFTSMIDGWRHAWGKEFPFYYVQIAPFNYRARNTGALLREAQQESMSHPRTGMVVTTDLVSNVNDVHPSDKHDVGARLANWALADTYHQQGLVYQSPTFRDMVYEKDKLIISFDHAEQGLFIKGDTAAELWVAGKDKIFHPATALIKNSQLVVWSKEVKHPVAARYGFSNTAIGNIFSSNGLPVAPFRTDRWEVPVD